MAKNAKVYKKHISDIILCVFMHLSLWMLPPTPPHGWLKDKFDR